VTDQSTAATLAAEVVLAAGDQLGEGPNWDAVAQALIRVDISAGRIHRYQPTTGRSSTIDVGDLVGFAIPRRDGGLVAGVRNTIVLLDADGGRRTIARVEQDRPDNRFNDARCDAAGRLWAGTLSMVREPGAAALYRVDPDGAIRPVIQRMTSSNGLGWSPDDQSMYLIDSPTQRIDVLDFDVTAGTLHDRRPLVEIDARDGLPDGLTVDAEGCIWVALFGGAAVRRYTPDGKLDAVVPLPTMNCTCPAFGGAELDELYVTSARHRLDDAQLAAQPLAGALFRAHPGARGRLPHRFGG
jgi:sugar lactone lactonase YvrE